MDGQLAGIKKTLVEEVEKIAQERETVLTVENEELRKEISKLRREAGLPEAGQQSEPEHKVLSTNSHASSSPTSPTSSTSPGQLGRLEASPEIAVQVKMGGLLLHDSFWARNAARPDHDHGFCQIDDDDDNDAVESHIAQGQWFTLNPTGNIKLCWDVLGIPILAWDLITIPMQIFGIDGTDVMVYMGWVTLLFWTVDVPFCFATGYFDPDGELIMDFRKIAKHYMRGLFGLDMLIIGADWISIIMEAVSSGAPGFLSNMSLLRALRISRFARLMRLRKLKAKWQTIEDNIESEWVLVCLNLFTKVMMIIAMVHYVGCVFFALGTLDIPGYPTWLSTPYTQYTRSYTAEDTFQTAPWGYQYATALHFALAQFTPGGIHIQPQNIPERFFTIFCLLFGLVVFSAFIANVTQARMQLNKLMSKFERDLWLLRKFCRQHKISHQLTVRMRRYVDLVLIPKFQSMGVKDVILLPQLSEPLREELQTEIESRKLAVHPFFKMLQKNKTAMCKICNTALKNILVARGDVVFSAGLVSEFMYIITSGVLDYIPHHTNHPQEKLKKDRWLCEAALWSQWVYLGQMQGAGEATAITIHALKFRSTLADNPLYMNFARHYAEGFLNRLNGSWREEGSIPSDMQEEHARAQFTESVKQMGSAKHRAPSPKNHTAHPSPVSPTDHVQDAPRQSSPSKLAI